MPQPLSRVKPDASVFLTAKFTHDHLPQLVAQVAHVIAISAHIENLLAGVLMTMLGAQAKPAAAMLRSMHSLGVKSQAVRAAAEEALEPDMLDLFTVVTDICDSAAKHRNRFVHWSWAHSADVFDALLFIDPRAMLAHEASAPGGMYPNEGRGLFDEHVDKSGILVYRDGDLRRAVQETERAHDRMAAFRPCIIPFVRNDPDIDSLYRRLLKAPDVAAKLAALRARRRSAQEAPPE